MKYSQLELLDEGFWDLRKSPILKGIGKAARVGAGAAGAAVKGTAKALDYVAPEITHPVHRLEAGLRDIGGSIKQGYDYGQGGLQKEYEDILLDSGYIMDKNVKVIDSGKNKVVVGYRIVGQDASGNPIPDKKKRISFLFDRQNNFRIIKTSEQDTTSMNRQPKPKYRTVKPRKK